jgi:hypothetical protein
MSLAIMNGRSTVCKLRQSVAFQGSRCAIVLRENSDQAATLRLAGLDWNVRVDDE